MKNATEQKIGILGGGQLGRMLIQKAVDLDLDISVLDPDPDAPCRFLVKKFQCGNFNDFETVYNFGKNLDLITIEIEHVNVEALEKLEKEGVTIYPQPAIIKLVQDKGEQKNFYKKNKLPTATFELIDDRNSITMPFPFIMKTRKGGYDGKGVIKISSAEDLLQKGFETPSVVEEVIPFTKEISIIVARTTSGQVRSFPAVEMEFNAEANLVEFLFSPADISKDIESKAIQIAETIAHTLKLTGILAVEMFMTKTGELFVNEIAPRPHNSGHHTIEGNITSQYEQHLRAILDLPLGDTSLLHPSVMINLLGEKENSGAARYHNLQEALKLGNIHIHLYGKKSTKPFRKMGHVTVTANELNEAKRIARNVQELIRITT